ncbi:MAG: 3-oxoacyl-ACP synthase, partial [Bacteroidales bacterium]|nr:3-oxoacyl-ACP synthase [Bacteroidales bacterium]
MATIMKSVFIANSRLFIDGNLVLQGESPIFVKFLKEVYKFAEIKYPKYYKMDPLSKLGFVASEVLLQDKNISVQAERVGIALGNRASTYLVDTKHQETINDKENYFPSPANFVYTLPNVMTGEMSIRNGFKGENAVFVMEKFGVQFLTDYLNSIYKADKADIMIGGFIDADEDTYEAFLFLTKKEDDLNAKEIDDLYKEMKKETEKSERW